MKKFNILAIIMLILSSTACKTEIEQLTLAKPDKVRAPQIKECTAMIIQADNLKEETVISWEEADFGQHVQIQYLVNMSFQNRTARVGSSFGNSLRLNNEELNTLLINELGIPANKKQDAILYIQAELYNGEDVYPAVSSEKKTVQIMTYAPM